MPYWRNPYSEGQDAAGNDGTRPRDASHDGHCWHSASYSSGAQLDLPKPCLLTTLRTISQLNSLVKVLNFAIRVPLKSCWWLGISPRMSVKNYVQKPLFFPIWSQRGLCLPEMAAQSQINNTLQNPRTQIHGGITCLPTKWSTRMVSYQPYQSTAHSHSPMASTYTYIHAPMSKNCSSPRENPQTRSGCNPC